MDQRLSLLREPTLDLGIAVRGNMCFSGLIGHARATIGSRSGWQESVSRVGGVLAGFEDLERA